MNIRSARFWFAVEWTASFLVATVFLLASIPKIGNPGAFSSAVHQMDLLPAVLVNPVAIYLPWIECLSACFLILLPPARRGALALLGFLLALFTVALLANFARGTVMTCGCFGGSFLESILPPWTAPLRNVLLLAIVCIALEAGRQRGIRRFRT
ncbi:MAG: MauE/DoxX family redox-associated membrane protein [bacterium]